MCTVCGCGGAGAVLETGSHPDDGHEHDHVGPDGRIYRHRHDHTHFLEGEQFHDHQHDQTERGRAQHRHAHGHSCGHDHHHDAGHGHLHDHNDGVADDIGHEPIRLDTGPAGTEVAGLSQSRLVSIEQDILAKNDRFAAVNRQLFAATGTFTVNLMSSPGSGKTTLLTRTLTDLKGRYPVAVIEGDQQTSFDAERIRATGAPAIQINTGKGCHLDAQMVTQAVGVLKPTAGSLLFVENVGNLVCPAGFDLGENRRVVVISVTEGEDKPLKYPGMFASADLMVINKIDLLPHLSFDVARLIDYARRVKPELEIIQVSATTGAGLEEWYAWLAAGHAGVGRG
jgi:hydrogenase nickel incorporation protein HypB